MSARIVPDPLGNLDLKEGSRRGDLQAQHSMKQRRGVKGNPDRETHITPVLWPNLLLTWRELSQDSPVNYFPQGCDLLSNTSNLRKQGLTLDHSLSMRSIEMGKACCAGDGLPSVLLTSVLPNRAGSMSQ